MIGRWGEEMDSRSEGGKDRVGEKRGGKELRERDLLSCSNE